MNIPEWQSKVMKCSAKTMMKQATLSAKLDRSGSVVGGNYNDEYQQHLKYNRKIYEGGIPGRKKWTRKGAPLDGVFPESKFKTISISKIVRDSHFQIYFAEIHKKRGPIPGKKYGTKKSKLLKQQQEALQFGNASANLKNGFIGYQPDNQTSSSNVNNSFEGSDNCGLTSRSKNTSPVPSKSEK